MAHWSTAGADGEADAVDADDFLDFDGISDISGVSGVSDFTDLAFLTAFVPRDADALDGRSMLLNETLVLVVARDVRLHMSMRKL
jgi:hypothetical protein